MPIEPSKIILVLDDEELIRDLLSDALQNANCQIIRLSNGKEAIEELHRQPVDLLITDIVMPEQDGLETIRIVRKLFPEIKILAISAYGSGNYLKVARLMGATETLAKPLDMAVLQATVKSLLES